MCCSVHQFLFLPAIGRVMTVEMHRKTRTLASILSLRYRVCSRVQSTGHRHSVSSRPLLVDICCPLPTTNVLPSCVANAQTDGNRLGAPSTSSLFEYLDAARRSAAAKPLQVRARDEALFWSTASQQKEDSPYAIFGLLPESDVKAEYEGSGHQRCHIEPICNRRYVTCMVKLQGSPKSGPQVW